MIAKIQSKGGPEILRDITPEFLAGYQFGKAKDNNAVWLVLALTAFILSCII